MTYSSIAASGSGELVYWLRISGFPWVLATRNLVPPAAATWYWSGATAMFSGVKPWLSPSGLVLDESVSLADGTLDVGPLDVEIVDVGGGFSALMGEAQYRNFTRLAGDITAASGGPLQAESVAAFAAAGVIWVDQEAIKYTAKTAVPDPDEFQTLTRGWHGTIAAAHQVDTNYIPPVIPLVLDGPTVLGGRRANLYAAEVSRGAVVGAAECVYRGLVAPDSDAGQGCFRLRIDHISSMWSRKVGQRLPTAALRPGFSFTGGDLSHVRAVETDTTAMTWLTADCEIVAGYRPGGPGDDTYKLACSAAVWSGQDTAGFSRPVSLGMLVDHERVCLYTTASAVYSVIITVREGDYLYAIGFDPGDYEFGLSAVQVVYEAQRDPFQYFGEITTSASTTEMECQVSGILGIENGEWATLGRNPAVLVKDSVPGTVIDGDLAITFDVGCDPVYTTPYIAIDNSDDLVFQHVLFLSDATETISTALQKVLGVSGVTFPTAWVLEGLEADDFEFTELTTALVGTPTQLRAFYDCVKEPSTVGELICDRLGLVGVVPRITTEARIGFAAVRTPHEVIADSVEVDSSMWSIVSAAKIRTAIEGIARMTQVRVESGHDYRSSEWGQPITILCDGVNNLGKTISKDYRCRGLIVGDSVGGGMMYTDFADLVTAIQNKVLGVHLGLLGRGGPVVPIACTWTSRQLLIGDIVLVTHPCVHDVAAGVVGVTDRLGIVVGRTLQLTDQGEDVLKVLIPAEQNVGPISPCALATAWNPANLTLSVPTTNLYAQTGENDLSWFAAGQELRFTEYDAALPATFGPTTIDSVGANSIVLDADPFGGVFPAGGCWCHWATYDECTAAQKLWLFFGDTSYSLGAAGDDCYVWAI